VIELLNMLLFIMIVNSTVYELSFCVAVCRVVEVLFDATFHFVTITVVVDSLLELF